MTIDINYIISELLKLAIPVLVAFVASYVHKHNLLKKLETKHKYVKIAVHFVEQAYKNLDGKEKYKKALDWASNQLNDIGIKTNEGELQGMIENAVKEMHEDFNNDMNRLNDQNKKLKSMNSVDPGDGGS